MTEESLFARAIAITDAAAQEALLDRECAGKPELRREVEELLAAHYAAGCFLAKPDLTGFYGGGQPPPELKAVGPYKLLQKIGEGGMGSVYMAEQEEPVRRRVAVKIIRAGMGSDRVIARFEAERQALALMDHPNIAKVLDAGATPDGRPYFVMELVKGVPITKFCDDNKLTPRERLELFVPVCQAIQHAHQKGVIHRDIKPSNVLVTLYDGKPVPKVIDFGVAKATQQRLTERTLFTEYGALIGTPEYMSPEQAEMNALDIDTRSDVYALGVLLYELLTGFTPIDHKTIRAAGYVEMLRLIREVEPPRPSARVSGSREAAATISEQRKTDAVNLSRLMKGELDWIVMKALEKDRSRRYESAAGFARDVERYLKDEMVEARPPTPGYRLRKLYRKNRAALLTAAVVAAVLLSATGVSLAFGFIARQAERIAEDRRQDAEANEGKARDSEARAVRAGQQLQDARDELWASLYPSRSVQIQNAWDARDYGRVRELLAAQVPAAGRRDLRGFEWYYIDRELNSDLRTAVLPRTSPSNAPISPDGTRLLRFVEAGDARLLKSFDTSTGREQFAIRFPSSSAVRVAYGPDGKWIVAAVHDQSSVVPQLGTADVRRWDAATGAEAPPLRNVTTLAGVVAGPAAVPAVWAQRTADDPGPAYRYWDGTAVTRVAPAGEWGELVVLAVSPDGSVLAVTGRKGKEVIDLLETRTGKSLARAGEADIPLGRPRNELDAGMVSFSPDGKRLAVAGGTLALWEVNPRRKLAEIKEPFAPAVFGPDGARFAYISGADAKIADVATGQVRRVIRRHDRGVTNLAFTRDGAALVTAGGDRVNYWDATTDERVKSLKDGRGADPFWARPSPDGTLLFRHDMGNPGFKVFDRRDRAVIEYTFPGVPVSRPELNLVTSWPGGLGAPSMSSGIEAAFSRDNRRLVIWHWFGWRVEGGKEVHRSALQLWNIDPWGQRVAVELPGRLARPCFSPDGRWLAALSEPGGVTVWDTETGKERFRAALPRGEDFVIGFSTDGSRLAAVGSDGESMAVSLWDAESGKVLPGANAPFGREWGRRDTRWTPPVLGPGGKRLAAPLESNVGPGARTTIVRVWDAETGARPVELRGFKSLFIGQMAFSPDGRRLATVSGTPQVLQLWDPDTGDELLRLPVDGDQTENLSFTPDGGAITLVVGTPTGFEARRFDGSPRQEPRKP